MKLSYKKILLIGIILVIAIILLTPLKTTFLNFRKNSFLDSVYNAEKAAEIWYTKNSDLIEEKDITFSFDNRKESSSIKGAVLLKTGILPKYGKVVINQKGQIKIRISNLSLCARKEFDESVIIISEKTKTNCLYD